MLTWLSLFYYLSLASKPIFFISLTICLCIFLSVGIRLCILLNATNMYIIYILNICKWVYPVFPSIFLVRVYHGYTYVNIGPCWVGTRLNIFLTFKQPNTVKIKVFLFYEAVTDIFSICFPFSMLIWYSFQILMTK